MDKAYVGYNPYALAYRAAMAGEYGGVKLRRDFGVYKDGDRLVYVLQNCAAADTEAKFILHIIPVDTRDLPPLSRSPNFENRDFDFKQYGGVVDGNCVAIRGLPDYEIGYARTGQYFSGEQPLWKENFGF